MIVLAIWLVIIIVCSVAMALLLPSCASSQPPGQGLDKALCSTVECQLKQPIN
jgi:hypothetical protein